MHEVVVVGAGPTGMMLAGELALAGVDVVLLEQRTTKELVGTRARGFHARTIEILDQRGIADRFLDEGQAVQALNFAGIPLDAAALPSRHPYTLALPQVDIERILRGWIEELGVSTRRGVTVTGFGQDDAGVEVHLADGDPVRASCLVGADGGGSAVRKAAGIELVGAEATRSHLIAEVVANEEFVPGLRLDDVGVHAMSPGADGRSVGVVVSERRLQTRSEATLAELRSALLAVYGTDFGVHAPRWISRFTDATRQATSYRKGRVLLAGDALHVHPPTGGQGVGLGVEDAVNLGWKLAQVVQSHSPADLLDTYRAERHPATTRVLDNVLTQAALQRGDTRTTAVRSTFAALLRFDEPRRQLTGLLSGLDVRHDLGEGHPLLGRRMPDLELSTEEGTVRVFELLRDARHVVLDLGGPSSTSAIGTDAWGDRVRHLRADCADTWELPVVGPVPAPGAVLIRPDGHVAWVGDGTGEGLREALVRWCGPGV